MTCTSFAIYTISTCKHTVLCLKSCRESNIHHLLQVILIYESGRFALWYQSRLLDHYYLRYRVHHILFCVVSYWLSKWKWGRVCLIESWLCVISSPQWPSDMSTELTPRINHAIEMQLHRYSYVSLEMILTSWGRSLAVHLDRVT